MKSALSAEAAKNIDADSADYADWKSARSADVVLFPFVFFVSFVVSSVLFISVISDRPPPLRGDQRSTSASIVLPLYI